MQSINSRETYEYETSNNLVYAKEEIKCNKTKMINFDDVTKEDFKEYNPNWLKILDHSHYNWRFWVRKNKLII